jgi:hypothetical protein
MIWLVATYALSTRSLVSRTSVKISSTDLRVLQLGCNLGEALAYDAGLYLRNLVAFDAGTAILADILRYAHLNKHTELLKQVEAAFDMARDGATRAQHGPFKDALRWLEMA